MAKKGMIPHILSRVQGNAARDCSNEERSKERFSWVEKSSIGNTLEIC